MIVYRQKETYRRQALLDQTANSVQRVRRSAGDAETSTLSLSFAVNNANQGVLVYSQSSDNAFTLLYVRCLLFESVCLLLSGGVDLS